MSFGRVGKSSFSAGVKSLVDCVRTWEEPFAQFNFEACDWLGRDSIVFTTLKPPNKNLVPEGGN